MKKGVLLIILALLIAICARFQESKEESLPPKTGPYPVEEDGSIAELEFSPVQENLKAVKEGAPLLYKYYTDSERVFQVDRYSPLYSELSQPEIIHYNLKVEAKMISNLATAINSYQPTVKTLVEEEVKPIEEKIQEEENNKSSWKEGLKKTMKKGGDSVKDAIKGVKNYINSP